MLRGTLLLVLAATMACAQGDQSDESRAQAERPLVKCDGTALPKTGDRCDSNAVPSDAYCRTSHCSRQCEDECRCSSGGVWECLLYCRDNVGCGTLPLCSDNCGADAATD